ncbi:MgtC/SapB family protein [Candidatus Woesearchaeota archaeon]|nr:MgtC/SapB family protein [Candidatus Woesearchaeota archaeon]
MNPSTFIHSAEFLILIKLIVAAAFGIAIGWDRESHERHVGIRTFGLVCMGSAAFTIIALQGMFGFNAGAPVSYDVGRIVGQLVLGIGFLGAGVIWKEKNRLHGLTTAASMWITAAMGAAIGLEMWLLAIGILVIAFLVLKSKPFLLMAFKPPK